MTGAPPGEAARALVAARARGEELEVYEKRGRSRRFALGEGEQTFAQSEEAGWAARGGDERGSYFLAGTGAPPPRLAPPERRGAPIRLPPPFAACAWSPPPALDAPLATESEGFALLAGIARELERELPGARARRLLFDDGAASWALRSSRGVAANGRSRACSLRVEAEHGAARLAAEFVARTAAEWKPLALARRIADRLLALRPNARLPPEGSDLVVAPPLAARLVEALAAHLAGPRAAARLAEIGCGDGRLGSALFALVDDGGDPRGALAAACDGEGVPSKPQRLVESGRFVRPLLAWWESDAPLAAAGISLRPGWRDPPRPGPTQLFVEPAPEVAVRELVESVASGAYLLAAEGGVRVEQGGTAFSVPISGFALERGRAKGGLGPCRLRGRFAALFAGLAAAARDLAFVPARALFGSPTLLLRGLVLERPPGPDGV